MSAFSFATDLRDDLVIISLLDIRSMQTTGNDLLCFLACTLVPSSLVVYMTSCVINTNLAYWEAKMHAKTDFLHPLYTYTL